MTSSYSFTVAITRIAIEGITGENHSAYCFSCLDEKSMLYDTNYMERIFLPAITQVYPSPTLNLSTTPVIPFCIVTNPIAKSPKHLIYYITKIQCKNGLILITGTVML